MLMTKKNTNIEEIRVEEVHDHEEGKHFFRVYFYYEDGKIEIMGESNIKPILARYVSKDLLDEKLTEKNMEKKKIDKLDKWILLVQHQSKILKMKIKY